ncbi:hypothetical protein MGYG_03119 [Nannizzia gypsea CBS 118893]|uniref:Uncharacterized protein n=1 Tax=Arthroderma gypseum (strain ATCC MYA-4604 / CBS 118893) TaxID=535722 RepID=E4UQZ8_ARTGP|nr:hypothetical protein MGYG_03119 [Nannizzia gypsea CBS 118893]EFR00113.1 hypothetical protein MGYG_03119 [Nannizzia gypsea CBS 118893]
MDGRLLEAVRENTRLKDIRLLVEDEADPYDLMATDSYYKTALQCALEMRNSAVCAYLAGRMLEQGRRLPVVLPPAVVDWARREPWFPTLELALSGGWDSSWSRTTSLTKKSYDALLAWLAAGLKLPETITARILDEAEFWVAVSVRRERELYFDENSRIRPYVEVECPALQGYLRRIDVLTVSHDQGWSSEGVNDSYGGSYTWFDIGVLRGGDGAEVEESLVLQANVGAQRQTRVHYNQIRARDARLAAWMAAVGPGDRLAVVPRALYPGWVNYVECIEMKLWYAHWHV